MTEIISSHQNDKIKEIIRLRKSGKRKAADLIVIEGFSEIKMAIKSGVELVSLFLCEKLHRDKYLESKDVEIPKYSVTEDIFEKISLRDNPDGFLALAIAPAVKIENIGLPQNPLVLVIEAVEKPGNLGAILRTADAAGLDAVLIVDAKADIYNPNVIRASLGTVFTNKLAVCTTEVAIGWLKKNKVAILAATPEGAEEYASVNYESATAIVIGTEHEGLSNAWLDIADKKIFIPMRGEIDSLNASVSAAVITFEAIRQRQK